MAKRALCVGINKYPIPGNDLMGCVNDANGWRDLLVRGIAPHPRCTDVVGRQHFQPSGELHSRQRRNYHTIHHCAGAISHGHCAGAISHGHCAGAISHGHCASAATDDHCASDHIGSHGYGYTT